MDSVISALAVLTDDNASIDGTLAVRAAALDAAIDHMAGDGCKVADSTGNGNAVVGVARTFERYLTGSDDTVAVPTQEINLVVGALADVVTLLNAADFDQQDNADEWAHRRDTAVNVLGRMRDQLAERRAVDEGGHAGATPGGR